MSIRSVDSLPSTVNLSVPSFQDDTWKKVARVGILLGTGILLAAWFELIPLIAGSLIGIVVVLLSSYVCGIFSKKNEDINLLPIKNTPILPIWVPDIAKNSVIDKGQKPDIRTAIDRYLNFANIAVRHTREKIYVSDTYKVVEESSEFQQIRQTVKNSRKDYAEILKLQVLPFPIVPTDPACLESMRVIANTAEGLHTGNCFEKGISSFVHLMDHTDAKRIELYGLKKIHGDHVFVITGDGEIPTYYDIVCDSWENDAYPISELNQKMKENCFHTKSTSIQGLETNRDGQLELYYRFVRNS